MADLAAIRKRLGALQSSQSRKSDFWKPQVGKQTIRIVPYKHSPDYPFVELLFHYNVGGKTYLSPASFGDPDPILEFANKLKKTGERDDWRAGKKMEPRLRTFAPVIVRGEENEGVRFWGFGKTVYQELLGFMADPDYGDITDPITGRDILVEYTSAEDAGTSFPQTKIRVRPKQTPISEDSEKSAGFLENQAVITELYTLLSYDELKDVLEKWLNPSDDTDDDVDDTDDTDDDTEVVVAKKPVSTKSKAKVDEVAAAFDEFFGD